MLLSATIPVLGMLLSAARPIIGVLLHAARPIIGKLPMPLCGGAGRVQLRWRRVVERFGRDPSVLRALGTLRVPGHAQHLQGEAWLEECGQVAAGAALYRHSIG